jgi:murein L,D-transpeptidase YafK
VDQAVTRKIGVVALLIGVLSIHHVRGDVPQADTVVVNKSRRELLLLHNGTVIRSYRVALGGSPIGPKVKQGDERTPEGDYVIDGRNSRSRFHLALHISYPNAADVARARHEHADPGGDIMIHGLPRWASAVGGMHRAIDWTDGCIAVTNREIEEIWRLVPSGTRIHINP